MKKLCFVEMEGILISDKSYSANEKKVKSFLKELNKFCDSKKIRLILLSGFHKDVAEKKFSESFLPKYFKQKNFFFVNEEYISSKQDTDEKIHRDSLKKDPEYNDGYFKQTIIQKICKDEKVTEKDALLLCDDIWIDGYYTTRFSKIDFALFEENLCDRGKTCDRISGLAYFSLKFISVKNLLLDFPTVDFSVLDRYVFNKMKDVLLGNTDFSAIIKKKMEQNEIKKEQNEIKNIEQGDYSEKFD